MPGGIIISPLQWQVPYVPVRFQLGLADWRGMERKPETFLFSVRARAVFPKFLVSVADASAPKPALVGGVPAPWGA